MGKVKKYVILVIFNLKSDGMLLFKGRVYNLGINLIFENCLIVFESNSFSDDFNDDVCFKSYEKLRGDLELWIEGDGNVLVLVYDDCMSFE